MTDLIGPPTLGRPAPTPAPASAAPTPQAGLTAGLTLLLVAVGAGLGLLVGIQGLITPGDAARTAEDVAASGTRFRLGVAGLYLVVALDVVAAWALFRFFAPVDVWLARLTAWLRVAYSAVFLVAISELAAVPDLLGDRGTLRTLGQEQLQVEAMMRIDSFERTWMAGLLLFGAHLALLGYLACRSGYVPRLIGVLLLVSGAGYAVDTLTSVVLTDPVAVSVLTGFGELVLAVWLVARGRRLAHGVRS